MGVCSAVYEVGPGLLHTGRIEAGQIIFIISRQRPSIGETCLLSGHWNVSSLKVSSGPFPSITSPGLAWLPVCKNSHISRQQRGQSAYTAAWVSLHNAVSQIYQMVAWDGLQSQARPQPPPPPGHSQLDGRPHPGESGGGGRQPGNLYFSLCFIHVLDSATISYTILVYTWSNYHTVYLHSCVRCKASSSET